MVNFVSLFTCLNGGFRSSPVSIVDVGLLLSQTGDYVSGQPRSMAAFIAYITGPTGSSKALTGPRRSTGQYTSIRPLQPTSLAHNGRPNQHNVQQLRHLAVSGPSVKDQRLSFYNMTDMFLSTKPDVKDFWTSVYW